MRSNVESALNALRAPNVPRNTVLLNFEPPVPGSVCAVRFNADHLVEDPSDILDMMDTFEQSEFVIEQKRDVFPLTSHQLAAHVVPASMSPFTEPIADEFVHLPGDLSEGVIGSKSPTTDIDSLTWSVLFSRCARYKTAKFRLLEIIQMLTSAQLAALPAKSVSQLLFGKPALIETWNFDCMRKLLPEFNPQMLMPDIPAGALAVELTKTALCLRDKDTRSALRQQSMRTTRMLHNQLGEQMTAVLLKESTSPFRTLSDLARTERQLWMVKKVSECGFCPQATLLLQLYASNIVTQFQTNSITALQTALQSEEKDDLTLYTE